MGAADAGRCSLCGWNKGWQHRPVACGLRTVREIHSERILSQAMQVNVQLPNVITAL